MYRLKTLLNRYQDSCVLKANFSFWVKWINCQIHYPTAHGRNVGKNVEALKKKSIMRLEPDWDSIWHHLECANNLTYLPKNFRLQNSHIIGRSWMASRKRVMHVYPYIQLSLPSSISLPATPMLRTIVTVTVMMIAKGMIVIPKAATHLVVV